MQVRKRAKSVSFGKHDKPKESEHLSEPKVHEEKVEEKIVAPTAAAKKVQEEKPQEPQADELVSAPVEVKEASTDQKEPESLTPSAVTPASEFLSDTPSAVSTTTTSQEVSPKATDPMVVEPVTTNVPLTEPILAAEPEAKPAETNGLSPTPPTSAFTIQGSSADSEPKDGEKKKHFVLYFFVVALISFILGLGAMAGVSYLGLIKGGLPKFAMNTQVLNKINPLNPTPTSIPTSVPTPVPTAKPADLKTYSISVLNGSGIVGKAAEVKTSLTEAGFKVTTSGNADRSDYTTTQIAAKKSVDKAYLDSLQTELKKTYKLDTVSTIPSDSTQPTDVIVTLGKETAN